MLCSTASSWHNGIRNNRGGSTDLIWKKLWVSALGIRSGGLVLQFSYCLKSLKMVFKYNCRINCFLCVLLFTKQWNQYIAIASGLYLVKRCFVPNLLKCKKLRSIFPFFMLNFLTISYIQRISVRTVKSKIKLDLWSSKRYCIKT